jgi:malonate transporter and related proteins
VYDHLLLDSLVPIFAVMALGYFAGWIRDIDNHHVSELNALGDGFCASGLIVHRDCVYAMGQVISLWPLLLAISVSMLALYALSFWMQRQLFGLSNSATSVQALTVAQPNYGAASLPPIATVFGTSHSIYLALTLASGSILLSPLTLAVLEAVKSPAMDQAGLGLALRAIGRSFLKPIVFSPIVGIVFSFLAVPVPDFIGRTFALIGQGAGGAAAFLTGLILSSQSFVFDSKVVSGIFLKNVLQPLSAAGLIFMLPMSRDLARATILLAAVPAGFFGVLFGLRYNVKSQEAGSTLIASSVLSAATLAVVPMLTGGD